MQKRASEYQAIADRFLAAAEGLNPHQRDIFRLRFQRSERDLFAPLEDLYGAHSDFAGFCSDLIAALVQLQAERPEPLCHLDLRRDLEPDWFLRQDMAGYVFYIDRFNGTLKGVLDKASYLEELGVTYVHFMPCLKPRPGDSDGGYSVMDYREINPALGAPAIKYRVSPNIGIAPNAKHTVWATRNVSAPPPSQEIGTSRNRNGLT